MSLNFASGNKKKISLGGRSKLEESREQILQRSQAERERRSRQRAEQKAAVVFQARITQFIQTFFFRTCCALRQAGMAKSSFILSTCLHSLRRVSKVLDIQIGAFQQRPPILTLGLSCCRPIGEAKKWSGI